MIASGQARVVTVGADGGETALNMLSPGETFGELALVEQAARSATVRASTPLEVLRLDRSVFLALIRVHPSLSDVFGIHARALHQGDFLRLHPAFSGLPRERLVEVVEGMREVVLADGEDAWPAGEPPAGLHMVTAGRLTATDADGRESYHLHTGDVFGKQDVGWEVGTARTARNR